MGRAENLQSVDWIEAGGPLCCVYCGTSVSSGQVDHVPPVAAVAVMPGVARWLYRACWLCNRNLGAYPVTCLQDRAGFLICKLRMNWLRSSIAGPERARVPVERIISAGRSVMERLENGAIRERCRCGRCGS